MVSHDEPSNDRIRYERECQLWHTQPTGAEGSPEHASSHENATTEDVLEPKECGENKSYGLSCVTIVAKQHELLDGLRNFGR